MQKKKWINLIKGTAFLLIVSLLLIKITSILNYKDTGGGGGWRNFYQTPQNTIDVMFFGNSHAHCTMDHGLLWNNYGIAGYTLSAGSQQLDSTYYFVKEAIEVQKPKVVVVEVYGALWEEISNSEETVYRNTLGMRWSANLWNFVGHMAESMGKDLVWQLKTFGKLFHIHSRYAELEKNDFEEELPFMRGYRGSYDIVACEKPVLVGADQILPLNEECEEFLYKIIDLTQETGTELVLMAAPFVMSQEQQMRLNRVEQIANEQQIPFIDYNRLSDEIQLDFSVDMRDYEHLNNDGAFKVTKHLAEYLQGAFELPDRRGQAGYELWDQNSKYLEGKRLAFSLQISQDIHEYLQNLLNLEGYTVVLTLNGNHTALGDVYSDDLAALGITYEEYLQKGAWVIKDGAVETAIPGTEYDYCYRLNRGEIHLESQQDEDNWGNLTEKAYIFLEQKEYAAVSNGVNIVVYDHEINQLIDSAGVDVYQGLGMIRQ